MVSVVRVHDGPQQVGPQQVGPPHDLSVERVQMRVHRDSDPGSYFDSHPENMHLPCNSKTLISASIFVLPSQVRVYCDSG